MRRLTLPLASLLVLASLAACGDASDSGLGQYRRGSASSRSDDGESAGEPVDTDHEDPGGAPEAPATGTTDPGAAPAPPASPGTASAELEVTTSTATPQSDLATSVTFDVTVTGKGGFAGAVALAATGLPAKVTATFAPASVTVPAGGTATAKCTIAVAVDAMPETKAIVVEGTSGSVKATANVAFKVNPQLTIEIPTNIDAMRAAVGSRFVNAYGAAFGATPTVLKAGAEPTVVRVRNLDATGHVVHGNGTGGQGATAGFAHGPTGNPIAQNQLDPTARTIRGTNTYTFYLHEGQNTQSVSAQIKIAP